MTRSLVSVAKLHRATVEDRGHLADRKTRYLVTCPDCSWAQEYQWAHQADTAIIDHRMAVHDDDTYEEAQKKLSTLLVLAGMHWAEQSVCPDDLDPGDECVRCAVLALWNQREQLYADQHPDEAGTLGLMLKDVRHRNGKVEVCSVCDQELHFDWPQPLRLLDNGLLRASHPEYASPKNPTVHVGCLAAVLADDDA